MSVLAHQAKGERYLCEQAICKWHGISSHLVGLVSMRTSSTVGFQMWKQNCAYYGSWRSSGKAKTEVPLSNCNMQELGLARESKMNTQHKHELNFLLRNEHQHSCRASFP